MQKILRNLLILLCYEARIDYRYWQNLAINLLFFVTTMIILQIILPQPLQPIDRLLQIFAIAIFTIISNSQSDNQKFLVNRMEEGSLDQMILAVRHLEIIIFVRLIVGWLRQIVPILLVLICYLSMTDLDAIILANNSDRLLNLKGSTIFLHIILITIVASFNISLITAFCGSFALIKNRQNNQMALATIIAVPMLIPTILVSQVAIFNDFTNNFTIICSLAIILLFLTIWGIKQIIEIAR